MEAAKVDTSFYECKPLEYAVDTRSTEVADASMDIIHHHHCVAGGVAIGPEKS